jgi:nucleotide-binding universal stress UspA family protein
MRPPRSVLAPVDFSDDFRCGLALAGEFARRFEAAITLLHVHDLPALALEAGAGVAPPAWSDLVGSAREGVERLALTLAEAGVEAHAVIVEGPPARTIIDYAREHACDLIVMGTHGRTGLDRVLSGSVAEQVVRGAPCPVLTVRMQS